MVGWSCLELQPYGSKGLDVTYIRGSKYTGKKEQREVRTREAILRLE